MTVISTIYDVHQTRKRAYHFGDEDESIAKQRDIIEITYGDSVNPTVLRLALDDALKLSASINEAVAEAIWDSQYV
jgi:hypothetical protein